MAKRGRPSREDLAQRAASQAEQASEAGRVLQAQRQPSSESAEQVESTGGDDDNGERAPVMPRNEPRRLALEEIRRTRSEGQEDAPPAPEPEPLPAVTESIVNAPEKAETVAEVPVEQVEPEKVKVKVDGEEFEVLKSEVEEAGGVTAYQKDRAAANRLEKSNQALAQTRQMQAQMLQMFQQSQQPQTPKLSDSEWMTAKVDAIRFGTAEESTAAFQEVLNRGRVDPATITAQAVNQMQQNMAVQSFRTEFQDIATNPLMLKLAVTLENERKAQSQGPIDWSDFYRRIGNEIRSVMPSRPSQPPQTPAVTEGTPSQQVDKEARKSTIVNLPTAAARAAIPEESKPETREESLARMKRARGQPVG